jgi:hypothetical protein
MKTNVCHSFNPNYQTIKENEDITFYSMNCEIIKNINTELH